MSAVVAATIVVALVFVVGAAADVLVVPIINLVLAVSVEPLTIPIVNQVVLWGQLCAAVVVIVVRILKGLYEVGLSRGSDRGFSFGEWAFKTALSIMGVAMMPVFCNMVISVGSMMFSDVQGAISPADLSPAFGMLDEDEYNALWDYPLTDLGAVLCNALLLLFVIGSAIKVAYELFKRQLVMLVICVTATWVSIKASMDRADDYLDLLVSLFGLCLTQVVQYLFLCIGISMFTDYSADCTWLSADFLSGAGLRCMVQVLAALGCAMAVPAVLERYAFSSGRGGAGSMIVGMALRTGVSGIGRAVSGAMAK